jgi:hypothetical protein
MLLFLNIISLYIEALVPSFHKPLKTSSIKIFGLLSEPAGSAGCFHYIDAALSRAGSGEPKTHHL